MSSDPSAPSRLRMYVVGGVVAVVAVALAGFGVPALMDMMQGDPWLEHGFTKGQRRALKKHFDEGIVPDKKDGGVAGGALCLIHQGEVVVKTAFGYADVESERPFTTTDPVRLASASKPITATVLLVMHDQGLVDIDEPISTYLQEFKRVKLQDGGFARRAPTIREAFSHMGGMPPNKDVDDDRRQTLFSTGPETITRALARFGLVHEPGIKEVYSGVGYIVASRVAEVVAGKGFEEVMGETLLDPLGMTDTTFRATESLVGRMPTLYQLAPWGFDPQPPMPVGEAEINPAGGLISTLEDMATFYSLHANRGDHDGKRLLSQATIEQMYMPQSDSGEHGLGFNTDEYKGDGESAGKVMHGGKTGVYAWLDFDTDLVGILLTQTDTTQNRDFRFKLVDMVTQFAATNTHAEGSKRDDMARPGGEAGGEAHAAEGDGGRAGRGGGGGGKRGKSKARR